jgi:hypothetical protein
MPFYACTICGCYENTALGEYWTARLHRTPVRCSACASGTWHGQFPRASACGMLVDQGGHLWFPWQVMQIPGDLYIIGIVSTQGDCPPYAYRRRSAL